jgi:predicted nucleic acid binding AN1-type Zn finger protein
MGLNRCTYCLKKRGFSMACKYCKQSFCTSCLQPEYHSCAQLAEMVGTLKSSLQEQLEKNKCVKAKLEKI